MIPTDPEAFRAAVPDGEIRDIRAAAERFALKIPARLAAVMGGRTGPLWRQFVPSAAELAPDDRVSSDPLWEEAQSPVPGLIHRYPDRVVFLVSDACAAHCRFCMRRRRVAAPSRTDIAAGIRYIRETPETAEVILSGGDPLMRSDRRLAEILAALHAVPHVRVIRIHTRMPVVLPERITPDLASLLKKFHPLFMILHINHPAELLPDTDAALARLADAGIPLGSQSVLLRGVNDDAATLRSLFRELTVRRVRPYYLHQCDPLPGISHFHVPLEKGISLMERLRGHISGIAVPHFMVDLPGGGGKIPLLPENVRRLPDGEWEIRGWADEAPRRYHG